MSEKAAGVVLAGGKLDPEMQALAGGSNRALISVGGRTMLDTVVAALDQSGLIGQMIVIGDVPESSRYLRLSDAGGFVENVFAGAEAARDSEYVLLATADLPFLSAESIRDFLSRALPLQEDVVYAAVPVDLCYYRYPGIRRTSIRLREGRLTGGNIALVRREFMETQRERLLLAYSSRKSPVRLASMLGFGTIGRFVMSLAVPHVLRISDLERAMSRFIQGNARALISNYPELATDIDRPSDLQALSKLAGSTA